MRILHILKTVIVAIVLGCATMASALFVVFMISLVFINPKRNDVYLLAHYPDNLSIEQIKHNAAFIGSQYGPYARMRYVKCHTDSAVRVEHAGECMIMENSVGRPRPNFDHHLSERLPPKFPR